MFAITPFEGLVGGLIAALVVVIVLMLRREQVDYGELVAPEEPDAAILGVGHVPKRPKGGPKGKRAPKGAGNPSGRKGYDRVASSDVAQP